jgi:hypothetical protein
MEILILLVQYTILTVTFITLFLTVVSVPYAIGRAVGRRQGRYSVVDHCLNDEGDFQLWLIRNKIRRNKEIVAESRHCLPKATS